MKKKSLSTSARSKLVRSPLLLIVVLGMIILLPSIVAMLFWNWYIIEVKEIPVEVTVIDTTLIGFNTGTDKLYFGSLVPEGYAERKAAVVSSEQAVVSVRPLGSVASWISVTRNDVQLAPNDAEEIIFRLTVPVGTPPGNYTGYVRITYHKPFMSSD